MRRGGTRLAHCTNHLARYIYAVISEGYVRA